MNSQKSYWLDTPLVKRDNAISDSLKDQTDIVIVGSGLAGVSVAYWLLKQHELNVTLLDFNPERAATNRNCGHILHGTVETIQTMQALHGDLAAKQLWQFSIDICDHVKKSIHDLGLDCEYKQDGYLVIAIDEAEDRECQLAVETLTKKGFHGEQYLDANKVRSLGFKNVFGARYEEGSAQAHPVKFRNGILKHLMQNKKFTYHSDCKVTNIDESGETCLLTTSQGRISCEIAVLATNSYSGELSHFIKAKNLIEPYKGQIITSNQLNKEIKVSYPHSFDHGYIYSLKTVDNRLMIGGWRNHTDGQYGNL